MGLKVELEAAREETAALKAHITVLEKRIKQLINLVEINAEERKDLLRRALAAEEQKAGAIRMRNKMLTSLDEERNDHLDTSLQLNEFRREFIRLVKFVTPIAVACTTLKDQPDDARIFAPAFGLVDALQSDEPSHILRGVKAAV